MNKITVEKKQGGTWRALDCHTSDNTYVLDMLALRRAGKLPASGEHAFLDGVTCRVNEHLALSCGCCTGGCVCAIHQDTPNGLPPNVCDYHKEHGHPRATETAAQHDGNVT